LSASKRRVAASGTAALGLAFGLAWSPAVAGAVPIKTLFVSPSAPGSSDKSCATATFATVSTAVTAANPGDTIEVCPGTYHESVVVNKQLTIDGNNGGPAIIDAVNQANGISIMGVSTVNTVIQNLTIENAKREGVTIGGTSGIQFRGNTVTSNDQMCQPQLTQDDCGESVDLEAVTGSTFDTNMVTKGTGGFLISDGIPQGSIGDGPLGPHTPFSGPTSGNTFSNNTVTGNIWDCGITMPGHNSNAVGPTGPNQTPVTGGGVFGNTVTGNTVTNNGTAGGGGSGILMAAPFPGTGSYGNTITGNHVSGNGQGGIVVHSHAPGQDLNGNKFLSNVLGTNAVGENQPGTGIFTSATTSGDGDAGDPATTAIEVFSGAAPITGTVIDHNSITKDHYGVVLENASASVTNGTYSGVAVPVYNVPPPDSGYALVGTDGSVFHHGNSPAWGSALGVTSGAPIVGIAQTPIDGGYWLATNTGGVFSYGDTTFYGSLGGLVLNGAIVGITATPDGHGYWMVAKDGGVFAFGDAKFMGSLGNVKLAQPVVGMASTPDGMGYWLVAKDGGLFAFGDAKFHGSLGNVRLNQPIVAMTSTSDGMGYWMTASDGGVFAFGTAKFKGSTGGVKLAKPVVAITSTSDNGGYWLAASDGGVFTFGNGKFFGSSPGATLAGVSGMYSS
jgi:parallel beta-helix repeat protein